MIKIRKIALLCNKYYVETFMIFRAPPAHRLRDVGTGLSAQMRLGQCRGFARAVATLARARPCVGLPSVASAGRKTIGLPCAA